MALSVISVYVVMMVSFVVLLVVQLNQAMLGMSSRPVITKQHAPLSRVPGRQCAARSRSFVWINVTGRGMLGSTAELSRRPVTPT